MMADPREPANRSRRKVGALLKAVAIRVLVWGGVVLLALLFFGDVRSIILPTPSAPRRASGPEAATPTGPGWPHLRGPHYDGISQETGLPDTWPPEGPPVLWIRHIGQGYSGFAAVGGRVYTQTQTTYAQSVVCLDGDTGEQIWQYRYGWPYEAAGMYPGPRATPTWHQGRIYFAGPRGLVGCLQASDGRLIWSVNVKEKFDGRGTDFGCAASPLVEDGKVVLPVGGEGASIVALDARDGSTIWASGGEPASYCSAIPVTVGGRRHVVALLQNALVAMELETGRPLWQHVFSRGYDEHAAFPLYEQPHLMVASPFRGGSEMYRLEIAEAESPGGAAYQASATRVWFSRRMSNDVASSVLADGYVYGFDLRDVQSKAHRPSRGEFTCMKLETGEVQWTSERPGHASVIVADGKLILFNDTGEVLLARVGPDRYEELAHCQVFGDEICWTAPALHRGRLYLRTPTKAACLYIGRPDRLDRRRYESARRVAELPKPRRIDFMRMLSGEREYMADQPTANTLRRWYAYCLLGVLGAAGAAAALVYLVLRIKWPVGARRSSRVAFWATTFLVGLAAAGIANRLGREFVFTWPASLFAAHQVTLIALFWSQPKDRKKKHWWVPVLAGLAFVAICLGYFHACRTLGLAAEWGFLTGFLPSWPIALPAAHRLCRDRHVLEDAAWAVLSFSAYYWACGGFMLWRAT